MGGLNDWEGDRLGRRRIEQKNRWKGREEEKRRRRMMGVEGSNNINRRRGMNWKNKKRR
jgi:hypothetical protein